MFKSEHGGIEHGPDVFGAVRMCMGSGMLKWRTAIRALSKDNYHDKCVSQ